MMRMVATVQPKSALATVLTDITQVPAWRSTLVSDPSHPFFFDHPLDHVPGIMLITALLDLVRSAAAQLDLVRSIAAQPDAAPPNTTPPSTSPPNTTPPDRRRPAGRRGPIGGGHRIRTSLWFPRFCELDEPTELRVCPSSVEGGWTVQASQSRGPVCLGSVAIHQPVPGHPGPGNGGPDRRYRDGSRAAGSGPDRADGTLVHRARPENILVSGVYRDDGGLSRVAVLDPGTDDHFFPGRSGELRQPEELIEAARQAVVMRWPVEYGWPVRVKLTLNALRADLPMAVDRGRRLDLRWSPGQPRGAKDRMRLDVLDAAEPANAAQTNAAQTNAAPTNANQTNANPTNGNRTNAHHEDSSSRAGADATAIGQVTIDSQAWTESQWQRLRASRS